VTSNDVEQINKRKKELEAQSLDPKTIESEIKREWLLKSKQGEIQATLNQVRTYIPKILSGAKRPKQLTAGVAQTVAKMKGETDTEEVQVDYSELVKQVQSISGSDCYNVRTMRVDISHCPSLFYVFLPNYQARMNLSHITSSMKIILK